MRRAELDTGRFAATVQSGFIAVKQEVAAAEFRARAEGSSVPRRSG
jgi:hypothetical protein